MMGDRCSVTLTIHGEITKKKQLNAIAEALNHMNPWADVPHTVEEVMDELAQALANKENPSFDFDEVNYGNTDELEQILIDDKVAFSIDKGSGGDYGESCCAWKPGMKSTASAECLHGDGPAMSVSEIRTALEKGTLEAQLQEVEMAGAKGWPDFSAGGEVLPLMATRLAKKALKVA